MIEIWGVTANHRQKMSLYLAKNCERQGTFLCHRSYSMRQGFDKIPRSNNLLSILLLKGCESIVILGYFDQKGIVAGLSLDGGYKSRSTFVEICHFSRRGQVVRTYLAGKYGNWASDDPKSAQTFPKSA